jgi:hypothetical protein
MTNLELRMTAQEQHLVALSIGDPVGQGRIDALARHLERRQDLAGPA